MLAVEALNLMQSRHVTSLLVANDNKLLHMHDLHKPVLYNIRKYMTSTFWKPAMALLPILFLNKAEKIKLLICDVDGVMSDGLVL